MNARLANAVVQFIADPSTQNAALLHSFSRRDWSSTRHWLITSGLALHLRTLLIREHAADCIPPAVRAELNSLYSASTIRTAELRKDFLALNRPLIELGIRFVNWKGFALQPDFCPDIRLRPQMDFDFIVLDSDADRIDAVLRNTGFQLTGRTEIEATYETLPGQHYTLEQVYSPKPQRKIELHFGWDHGARGNRGIDFRGALNRRRWRCVDGQPIPVLASADAFLAHAAHAGRHALEGWVRLGWLLELDSFIRLYRDNAQLWDEAHRLAQNCGEALTSVAVGILLGRRCWRTDFPAPLRWVENAIPISAVEWIERFGARLAMADFPGTKLNLLLQRELICREAWRSVERAYLFRPRAIPRVARAGPDTTLLQRARAAQVQLRFVVRRLRFHCVETVRYFLLKRRWSAAP